MKVLKESFSMRPFPQQQMDSTRFADKSLVTATLRVHVSIFDQVISLFGEDRLTEDGPDFYIAQVKLPLDELAYRYLLGFGSRCTCLAPEELNQRVYDLAAEVCKPYSEFDHSKE